MFGYDVWGCICGLFCAGVVRHDAADIVDADVEIVHLNEEGDYGLFWWLASLNDGSGVAFIAHFTLGHADEIGAENTGKRGNHVCDHCLLRSCERLLNDFVHNVHDIVDG